MVMMGQQLMDSERKQEDDEIDDYVIKPHNNHNIRSAEEQKQSNNSQQNMKRSDVPTLASLAQLSHQKHLSTASKGEDQDAAESGGSDNNNKIIKQVQVVGQEGVQVASENETAKMNGDTEHNLLDHDQDRPSDIIPSRQTSTNSNGETISTSSGRTSSCDSSGIGTSLTSSSSSEPMEREEAVSPSSENGDGDRSVVGNGINGDVPDNGTGGNFIANANGVSVPNGVINSSGSCQALLLAEDFNGQMTVAKRFLKMVRDGINENGQATTAAATSSRLKGGDSSTDEDNIVSVTNNQSSILNASNSTVVSNGVAASCKEKSSGSGRSVAGNNNKVPNTVPVPAAALNQHPVQEKGPPPSCVQEVWAHNLLEEFAKIRRIVKKYTYIAMDTEFPGIVVRPQCAVRAAGIFPYELLKVNVDRLKIIQLGVTFMDKDGKCPPGVCTWQFNFKFSLNKDLYASDSISLLSRCGIQFERHAEMGINPEMFGEYFMSSGMVTSDQVTYLTFHSGFDFGYLIKLLSNLPLPENEEKFFEIMKIYFPNVYDLKFLMKSVDLHGGLQDIANQMGQERVGTQHQAGSDSLLTGMTFFKLLSTDVFNGEIDEAKYCGKLYGFHMTEDGKDEAWSEITGENLMDATSPKPPAPVSRNSNSNATATNSLHPTSQSSQPHSSCAVGTSSENR